MFYWHQVTSIIKINNNTGYKSSYLAEVNKLDSYTIHECMFDCKAIYSDNTNTPLLVHYTI